MSNCTVRYCYIPMINHFKIFIIFWQQQIDYTENNI